MSERVLVTLSIIVDVEDFDDGSFDDTNIMQAVCQTLASTAPSEVLAISDWEWLSAWE